MDCSLRFYYKYVANIRELNTLTKEILKTDFGRITHKALQLLYIDIKKHTTKMDCK
ncbi:MAG: PD-(D/E)XK nuclease family protein [Cytophagales bacterium]